MNRTAQREAILEELRGVTTHPTADELYAALRVRMPKISLGTVYRNLEQLSQAGLVRKLDIAGKQRRFDGDISPHHHLRCRICGRVRDISQELLNKVDRLLREAMPDLGCDSFSLELSGFCSECKPENINKKRR